MDNIVVISKYTSELTEEDIQNYIEVFSIVYGPSKNIRSNFEKKYINNIYGDSLHIYAYIDNYCVGIQVFLRNDIDKKESYQSGDSATHPEYRGKGIFRKMVELGIEKLPSEAQIYGFPNNNSLPVFEKMGWKIGKRHKYKLFQNLDDELIEEVDDEYLLWMTRDSGNLYYFSKKDRCYLLKQKKHNMFFIIGKIEKNTSDKINLKRAKLPILFVYSEQGTIGNGMLKIYAPKTEEKYNIPVYKIDTLLEI